MSATSNLSPPKPTDIHVGSQLRALRKQRGLSQDRLAEALGVTFQQVQKYERGTNRVSASTLWEICRALKVSPNYFFVGLDAEAPPQDDGGELAPHLQLPFIQGGSELAYAFVEIDPDARKSVLSVVQAIHGAKMVAGAAAAA